MRVRPAEPRDAAGIAAIWNPIIRDTAITFTNAEKSIPDLERRMAEAPAFFVAERDGVLAGFVVMGQFRAGPGYARTMELTIHIAETARGQGAGRALLSALEGAARAQGVGSLWAGIGGENPGSVRFHSRLGFEEVATLPRVGYKFGRWMDLVLMRKWLG